jgi:hypothetical protein
VSFLRVSGSGHHRGIEPRNAMTSIAFKAIVIVPLTDIRNGLLRFKQLIFCFTSRNKVLVSRLAPCVVVSFEPRGIINVGPLACLCLNKVHTTRLLYVRFKRVFKLRPPSIQALVFKVDFTEANLGKRDGRACSVNQVRVILH